MNNKTNNINISITAISSAVVLILGILVAVFPEDSTAIANKMFNGILSGLGSVFLWVTLASLVFLIWLMLSKYGNIKLGKDKPEFTKPKIFAMIFCAAFGSATMYWCFTEVMYYYIAPPFGIDPRSALAAEWGLAYNFFHWGPSAWSLYTICAIPVVYSFYIKGNKQFKLSAICSTTFGDKWPKSLTKVVDILFIVTGLGAVSITLGLSIPMISKCISTVFGIQQSFGLNISIILLISIIFTISSYVGLGKGMTKLSDLNLLLCIGFLAVVLIIGDTLFTIDSITNSFGLMLDNYVRMSFWTDPVDKGGFPQAWTVFYWAYWIAFGPGMGVFIARILKGHRVKDVISLSLVAGTIGTLLMHGTFQSYTMTVERAGLVPAADMVANGQTSDMIVAVLGTLPFPNLFIGLFAVVAILFMATTLDSNSFTLASVATKRLSENSNPSPMFRLYWCLMLSFFPLILVLVNAELNTIKTIALTVAVPIGILLLFLNVSAFKGIASQFSKLTRSEIDDYTDFSEGEEYIENV